MQAGHKLATGRGRHFPNAPVFLLGLAMLLASAGVRLTDLEVVRIHHADSGP